MTTSTGAATGARIPLARVRHLRVHVKGFTSHPDLPQELRGTYAGLPAAVIHYLEAAGGHRVELLPVHEFLDDNHLLDRGLRNYWGYNTINYFAPRPAIPAAATGRQVPNSRRW